MPLPLCSVLLALAPAVTAQERTPIESAEELPAKTYVLPSGLAEFVESEEAVDALARAVLADLEDVFARYEIRDRGLEHELSRFALHAAIACEEWDVARAYLVQSRALESREDLQKIAGLHWEAWIDVCAEGDESDPDALRAEYALRLRELADAQPWSLVRQELGRRAARTGMVGRGLLDMAMRSEVGAAAAEGGEIDAGTAQMLVPLLNGVHVMLPLKSEIASTYAAYLKDNEVALTDRWGERTVALDPGEDLSEVTLAVWDTGVDVALFPGRMWTNPGEVVDGVDDDGNGFVDDVHGLAYGPDLRPTPRLLYPPHADAATWARIRSYDTALSDLVASIDSPEARALAAELQAADADEATAFLNDLMHYAVHSHGTHVAGIAMDGNPFARLMVARVGLDHREPGPRKTIAWAHRFAAMCHETVAHFVAHDVRVVNMSWGWGVAEIDANLRDTGFEGTEAERREHARAIHGILRIGIEGAIATAPEVLFVCGAGNSGDDSSRDRFVPSSSNLPNLVTVGGVDSACERTAFTSFGEHVSLYANGYRVESFVPGGEVRPQSGTSMSSPQVANLAAKLLAIEPGLGPAELVALMTETAEPARFAGRDVRVLDPRAAVGRLRATTARD